MIKIVALLKKKPGLSADEFMAYYEEHHAPLATRLTKMGHDYRRNYVRGLRSGGREVSGVPEFDVITEVWFRDQAAYDAFTATMSRPDIWQQVVADEERFLDRSASRIYVVDERASPPQADRTA